MECTRCKITKGGFKMSWYNRDMICQICDIIEEEHPNFEHARNEEMEEVRKGNTNFDGVGLPRNFHAWADEQLTLHLSRRSAVKELYKLLTPEE